MHALAFAVRKIRQLELEIRRVRTSDFHHPDVRGCLDEIERKIASDLDALDLVNEDPLPRIRRDLCRLINEDVSRFHKILGFILRSTNARNSFEIFDPLLRLAKQLLGPKTVLVLSSEWEYSPFADQSLVRLNPRYVFVGLPVMEAGNSLIIPLAGHELGHAAWRQREIDKMILREIDDNLIGFFCANQEEARGLIADLPDRDVQLYLSNTDADWQKTDWGTFARDTTQSICEEIFCDFVGVRIFGSDFLYAFQYLIAPNIGATLASYPKLHDRASHLLYAATQENCKEPDPPADYSDLFEEPSTSSDEDHLTYSEMELFLLEACHDTSKKMISRLLELARGMCDTLEEPLPRPTPALTRRARERLELGIPATGMQVARLGSNDPTVNGETGSVKPTLADVVNSGWLAYLDEQLWKDKPAWHEKTFEIINELVFKSLDVMEFEERTRDAPQG